MAWPTRTWTKDGWKDFKQPGSTITPEGLDHIPNWRDHADVIQQGVEADEHLDHLGLPEHLQKVQINPATIWDIANNPLYEAAATAAGLPGGMTFKEYITGALAKVGTREDHAAARSYLDDDDAKPWESLTSSQQALASAMREGYGEGYDFREFPDRDDIGGPDGIIRRNWGIDTGSFPGINDTLNHLHQWIRNTIITFDMFEDVPRIREGIKGEDYGIDGDIWEHYGLDKPPAPPKSMDVNYNFNLTEALPSSVTYSTPEGYPTLDLSTESVPYKETDFARYQADQDKAYEKWEEEWGNTSYGEPIDQTTTTTE